jgi:hypothetical protein
MEYNSAAFDRAMNELSDVFERYTGIVTLVTGKVAGKAHWAYALIPPQNWPAFLQVQSEGGYDLGDYASEILAQGKGKAPPKDVLEKIKDYRQDIDFTFGKDIENILSA